MGAWCITAISTTRNGDGGNETTANRHGKGIQLYGANSGRRNGQIIGQSHHDGVTKLHAVGIRQINAQDLKTAQQAQVGAEQVIRQQKLIVGQHADIRSMMEGIRRMFHDHPLGSVINHKTQWRCERRRITFGGNRSRPIMGEFNQNPTKAENVWMHQEPSYAD